MKTIFIDPFKKYQENTLFIIGTTSLILGSLLAYLLFARFDGVLDLHFVPHITIWQPLLDNIINTSVLTGILFMIAKYINKKTRIIDILNSVLIARIPYYILPLFNINNYIADAGNELANAIIPNSAIKPEDISIAALLIIIFFAILTITVLIGYITLLYNGYKVASHAKGAKPIILFCIAIIAAEIVSKMLITAIPY